MHTSLVHGTTDIVIPSNNENTAQVYQGTYSSFTVSDGAGSVTLSDQRPYFHASFGTRVGNNVSIDGIIFCRESLKHICAYQK